VNDRMMLPCHSARCTRLTHGPKYIGQLRRNLVEVTSLWTGRWHPLRTVLQISKF